MVQLAAVAFVAFLWTPAYLMRMDEDDDDGVADGVRCANFCEKHHAENRTHNGQKACERSNCAGCDFCPKPTTTTTTCLVSSPGQPWSAEDQQTIRKVLLAKYEEEAGLIFSTTAVTAAKAVRLGFHDCFKYEEGGGGCDGCLDWKEIDFRMSGEPRNNEENRFAKPAWLNPNRGLEGITEYLEEVYTDSSTGVSLKCSGKSRADLWAFAAIVAIEFGVQTNNDACNGKNNSLGRRNTTCLQDSDPLGCEVSLPRDIVFQTGRADCGESYMADKREVAPSGDLPGHKLTAFFKEQFGFTGRETVAIMGAHTMGAFHNAVTGYWYTYTTQQEDAFNNQYYRNMALKEDWLFEDTDCVKQGTSNGTRGVARWQVKSQAAFTNFAPVQWIQEKFICYDCHFLEAKGFVRPQSKTEQAIAACEGYEQWCKPGTDKWRFSWGRDEAGTHSDLGMYYNFEVDEDGFPTGCGLFDSLEEPAQYQRIEYNSNNAYLRGRKNFLVDQDCEKQMHAEPPGSTPLHQIVEEFADNKNAFFEMFVPTYEKMLSNGYSNLKPAITSR